MQSLTGIQSIIAVQIVNLGVVQRAFENQWAQILPMLEVKIGKEIKNFLQANPLLLRTAPLSYFVVTGSRSLDNSKMKAEALAAHIHALLMQLGQQLSKAQVMIRVFEHDRREADNIDDFKAALASVPAAEQWVAVIDHRHAAAIRAAVPEPEPEHGPVPVSEPAAAQPVTASLPEPGDAEPAQRHAARQSPGTLSPAASAAPNTTATQAEAASAPPQATTQPKPTPSAPHTAGTASSLQASQQRPNVPTPAPQGALHAPTHATNIRRNSEAEAIWLKQFKDKMGANYTLAYFPIWNVKREKLDTHRYVFMKDGAAEKQLIPYNDLPLSSQAIDLLLAERAAIDVPVFAQWDKPSALTVPIHLRTLLEDEYAAPIRAKLNPLPITSKRLLLVEILGIGPYTRSEDIRKAIANNRGICGNLIARLPFHYAQASELKGSGLTAIGYNLHTITDESVHATEEMDKLARMGDKLGCRSFIFGADNLASAVMAASAGITYVCGSAVARPPATPDIARIFDIKALYSTSLP